MTKRPMTWAAMAAAVLLASCSGSGETDLDTTAASESLATIVADALDRGELLLDRCPHDPSEELMARIVEAAGTDAFDEAMASEGQVFLLGEGFRCTRGVMSTEVMLTADNPPDRYEAYVDGLEGQSSDTVDITVNQRASSDHRGGELHRFCTEQVTEDDVQGHCEVAWLDESLWVRIIMDSPSPADTEVEAVEEATDTDIEAVEEAFIAELDDFIANLAQADG